MIARNVTTRAEDPIAGACELVAELKGEGLAFVVAFVDWRVDARTIARELQRGLGTVPTVGCTGHGVIGALADPAGLHSHQPTAVAIGFYGDWLRVGIGAAVELSHSPIARSRDAVYRAAAMLGSAPEALDPARHVAFTLVDGTSGCDDAFCIGSAAAAPQIRFVGGSASTAYGGNERALVWANGDAWVDAGVVCVLQVDRRFEAITSQHLIATNARTVVTAACGRIIEELDGIPAARRLRHLVAQLGGKLEEPRPTSIALARYIDGVPYVRSILNIDGDHIQLATAVDAGHVLHLMRPGDLIGKTDADLSDAAARLGGMEALLAFSCAGRHLEATMRGKVGALLEVFANYPTTGFLSFGEQSGMLLVNHTLTALAIGGCRDQ